MSESRPVDPPREVASHTLAQMGVWIELFYDLVFVAAILVFSSAVSHLHDGTRIGWVVIVFAAVWWIWLSTTVFTNRFRMTDLGHRLLLLLQMFLVVLIAIEARAGVVEDESISRSPTACSSAPSPSCTGARGGGVAPTPRSRLTSRR